MLGRDAAEVFADLHRDHGVVLRPHAAVERITGDGTRADGVQLADGTLLPADAVVVGINFSALTTAAKVTAAAGHGGRLRVRPGNRVTRHVPVRSAVHRLDLPDESGLAPFSGAAADIGRNQGWHRLVGCCAKR
ncbi:FAD-dependent oxidoreductase [Streptomyces arenae]|uniref:FAD-dependent oxidoreductase n=1 Tax=Streptomyces arenae TaxID=29301 RepID=UPI0031BB61AB